MTTPTNESAPAEFVIIGRLGSAHGIRGFLRLFPLSDVPGRFDALNDVWWLGRQGEIKQLHVAELKFGTRFSLVHFAGYDSPEVAAPLTHGHLALPREKRGSLPQGSYFIDDILGMQVMDETGQVLGRITNVIQTAANDIYQIEDQKREWLLPALKSVILNVDLKAKCVLIRLPDGLR